MNRYQVKPQYVQAVQWFAHGDHPMVERVIISSDDDPAIIERWRPEYGRIKWTGDRARPGDWIVMWNIHDVSAMTDEDFRARFQKIPGEDYPEDRRVVGH